MYSGKRIGFYAEPDIIIRKNAGWYEDQQKQTQIKRFACVSYMHSGSKFWKKDKNNYLKKRRSGILNIKYF